MKKTSRRRKPRSNGRFPFRDVIVGNSVEALRDESYSIIQKCVEDLLKDPELRRKIEYHARLILKAIAEKL